MNEEDMFTSPDYLKCALSIIDFQHDCILPGAAFEVAGSYAVLSKIQQLAETARKHQVPIIHVVRAYLADGSNVDSCRRKLVQDGQKLFLPYTSGADFPTELKPQDAPLLDWNALIAGDFQQIGSSDWVMYKSRWGAFYQTELEGFLNEQGIDTLIFAGCNFPNCPRTSMYEASERDFRIVLAKDAMSGVYEKGLQELANIAVTIMDTDEVCAHLATKA